MARTLKKPSPPPAAKRAARMSATGTTTMHRARFLERAAVQFYAQAVAALDAAAAKKLEALQRAQQRSAKLAATVERAKACVKRKYNAERAAQEKAAGLRAHELEEVFRADKALESSVQRSKDAINASTNAALRDAQEQFAVLLNKHFPEVK